MKTKLLKLMLLLVLIIASALFTGVSASTQSGFDIDWWTVDGGGGASEGRGYSLSGTIGQPDGVVSMGGAFALSSGFWDGGERILSYPFQYLFPLFKR